MLREPRSAEEERNRKHALLKALLSGPAEVVEETERVVREDVARWQQSSTALDVQHYRASQELAAVVEAHRWKRNERNPRKKYSSSLAEDLTERRRMKREKVDRKLAKENEQLLGRCEFRLFVFLLPFCFSQHNTIGSARLSPTQDCLCSLQELVRRWREADQTTTWREAPPPRPPQPKPPPPPRANPKHIADFEQRLGDFVEQQRGRRGVGVSFGL